VLPVIVPAKVPRLVIVPLKVQPIWEITITSVPDRPQESLQKEFRDPVMMAQEEGPPGVGVGQGAFGGQFLSPQALDRNIAAIPAHRTNVG
jgi:hypothetical protein